jgi:Fungal protein kinase
MHILGYVHRDVSAGNVLFYKGAGILCDLESAKRTTDLITHEVRTVRSILLRLSYPYSLICNKGTNQYEPVEVNGRTYLFRDAEDESEGPVFKFNCIHDLESTWWIALWVLFHHTPLDDEEDRKDQVVHAASLFPAVGTSLVRVAVFTQGRNIRKNLPSLHPSFRPATERLIVARKLLVQRYKIAEAGPSINEDAFDGLHQEMAAIWQGCRDEFPDIGYRWVLSSKHGATDDPDSAPQPSSKKLRIR